MEQIRAPIALQALQRMLLVQHHVLCVQEVRTHQVRPHVNYVP